MTTQRDARVPRQRPPADVRRRGAVYGIPTLPVDGQGRVTAGAVVVGYVGQTRQTVKQREGQHRDYQPFGDLIVGGSWVIEEGVWTSTELDEREQHYIRCGAVLVPGQQPQRPVYNIDCNRDNRDRIPPWDAVAHRQAREPGWQRPDKGSHVPRPRRAAAVVRVVSGWEWTPARTAVAMWAAGWLAVCCVVGWQAASGPVATWVDGLAYGAGVATTTVGLSMPGKRRRRRRSR